MNSIPVSNHFDKSLYSWNNLIKQIWTNLLFENDYNLIEQDIFLYYPIFRTSTQKRLLTREYMVQNIELNTI